MPLPRERPVIHGDRAEPRAVLPERTEERAIEQRIEVALHDRAVRED